MKNRKQKDIEEEGEEEKEEEGGGYRFQFEDFPQKQL